MYKYILKPVFFLFDPETIHHAVFGILKVVFKLPGVSWFLRSYYRVEDPALKRKVMGISFSNPIGLAAGFDKDAKLVDCMDAMGFGFIEIGTLTPKPQPGNPKPRLFRLPKDRGLINRMGFNNKGVLAAAKRLKWKNPSIIVGGNIGKNKNTPNDKAVEDYEYCFEALYDYVDYFVVNVSSPNTPNLRELQEKEPLKALLERISERSKQKTLRKPILLKIAPDLTNDQLDDIVEIVQDVNLDGLIATNTTIDRSDLITSEEEIRKMGNGGLSGQPLKDRANEVVKYLREKLGPEFPIIGVGGIESPQDALERLRAGATLLQIYTGFIYEGPSMIKAINKAVLKEQA